MINELTHLSEHLISELSKFHKIDTNHIQSFIKDDHSIFIYKEVGSQIIGVAYGYYQPRIDSLGMFMIYSIDVSKECRGLGYGSELISYFVDKYKDISSKIYVLTSNDNIPANKLYKKCGAKKAPHLQTLYEWK